jgi:hypothetical protein
VACIPVNPQFVESKPTLWEKYYRLTGTVAVVVEKTP